MMNKALACLTRDAWHQPLVQLHSVPIKAGVSDACLIRKRGFSGLNGRRKKSAQNNMGQ